MGCRAVTPHLVSLARRHQDKPFHLIATHRQGRPKDEVVAFIKGFGLSGDVSNFSVTNGGRHPGVAGNGYVPYYMIFDHTGRLVYDHMCGDYHGGDGLKMIERVDELLKKAPYLYLGKEPFHKIGALAERASGRNKLAAVIKEVEDRLSLPQADSEPAETKTELERLLAVLTDYRDRRLKNVAAAVHRNPNRVLSMLKELLREFRGTGLGEAVAAEFDKQKQSKELARAVGIHKEYDKVVRKLGGLRPCKHCKRAGHGFRPSCYDCHVSKKRLVAREVLKLKKLQAAAAGLPVAERIADTVKEYSVQPAKSKR